MAQKGTWSEHWVSLLECFFGRAAIAINCGCNDGGLDGEGRNSICGVVLEMPLMMGGPPNSVVGRQRCKELGNSRCRAAHCLNFLQWFNTAAGCAMPKGEELAAAACLVCVCFGGVELESAHDWIIGVLSFNPAQSSLLLDWPESCFHHSNSTPRTLTTM